MKCDELLKLLNEYIDGQANPELCSELEKHLGGCNPCRVVVDNLRKTISLYKGDQVYELPADFKDRLYKALGERWKARATSGPSASGPQQSR